MITLTLLSNADGIDLAGTVPVAASVVPSSKLQRIEFYLDGVRVAGTPAVVGGVATWQWDTKTATNAAHKILARAVYKANKAPETATKQVTVKNFVVPPVDPPTTDYNGVGAIIWSDGTYPKITNVDKMGLIGVPDSAFADARAKVVNGKLLGYATGAQVATANRPITVSDADASGWLLYTAPPASGGQKIFIGSNSSGYLANVANASYAQTWATKWNAFAALNHLDGVHIDNFVIDAMNFSVPGLTYPLYDKAGNVAIASQQAWADAQVKWLAIVGQTLKGAGQYVMPNAGAFLAGDPSSDNGELTKQWLARWASYASAIEVEYWLQSGDTYAMALAQFGWRDNWDGRSSVQVAAEAAGLDFCGLVYLNSPDVQHTRYGRGTWLLNWNGTRKGGLLAFPIVSADVWNAEFAKHPGQPTGLKAMLATGVWTRSYEAGPLYVNPTPSAQVLPSGATLASGDAIVPSLAA